MPRGHLHAGARASEAQSRPPAAQRGGSNKGMFRGRTLRNGLEEDSEYQKELISLIKGSRRSGLERFSGFSRTRAPRGGPPLEEKLEEKEESSHGRLGSNWQDPVWWH